jgi:hypothetical protein
VGMIIGTLIAVLISNMVSAGSSNFPKSIDGIPDMSDDPPPSGYILLLSSSVV